LLPNNFLSKTTSLGDNLYSSDSKFLKLLNSQVAHLLVDKSSKLIQKNQSFSVKEII
jgi:hypothetical protein